MFKHMAIGTNDPEKSKIFYDALMNVIGAKQADDPKGRLVYVCDGAKLIVTRPINGEAATPGNGMTVGFAMASTDMTDAWHAAGLAAGGTTLEDPPGWRVRGDARLYLAYLRDPDGNKLCAVFRED